MNELKALLHHPRVEFVEMSHDGAAERKFRYRVLAGTDGYHFVGHGPNPLAAMRQLVDILNDEFGGDK